MTCNNISFDFRNCVGNAQVDVRHALYEALLNGNYERHIYDHVETVLSDGWIPESISINGPSFIFSDDDKSKGEIIRVSPDNWCSQLKVLFKHRTGTRIEYPLIFKFEYKTE